MRTIGLLLVIFGLISGGVYLTNTFYPSQLALLGLTSLIFCTTFCAFQLLIKRDFWQQTVAIFLTVVFSETIFIKLCELTINKSLLLLIIVTGLIIAIIYQLILRMAHYSFTD